MGWTNSEWSVNTKKAPIIDQTAMGTMEALVEIPLPEILFGDNTLEVIHTPSQWRIEFSAVDALDLVDKTGEHRLQLAHSEKWKRSKGEEAKVVHRPFDWTYSTTYTGSESSPKLTRCDDATIPFEELKRPEPILFYDEVPLYEDELGDFGLTSYGVKVRVMPGNLFILARMYMRVDDVAFRIRDTRVFVDFRERRVIREYTAREAPFAEVKTTVPLVEQDYTRLLRDPDWVASVLPLVQREAWTLQL